MLACGFVAVPTGEIHHSVLIAFGEILTFAGSLQGSTRTLPLEIYLSRETDTETALTLALLLIVVAAVLMAGSAVVARRLVLGRG